MSATEAHLDHGGVDFLLQEPMKGHQGEEAGKRRAALCRLLCQTESPPHITEVLDELFLGQGGVVERGVVGRADPNALSDSAQMR